MLVITRTLHSLLGSRALTSGQPSARSIRCVLLGPSFGDPESSSMVSCSMLCGPVDSDLSSISVAPLQGHWAESWGPFCKSSLFNLGHHQTTHFQKNQMIILHVCDPILLQEIENIFTKNDISTHKYVPVLQVINSPSLIPWGYPMNTYLLLCFPNLSWCFWWLCA